MKHMYLELFLGLREIFKSLYLFFDGCYKDLLYQHGHSTSTTYTVKDGE